MILLAGVAEKLAANPKENTIEVLSKNEMIDFFQKGGTKEGVLDFVIKFYPPAIVILLASVAEQLAIEHDKSTIKMLPKSDLLEFEDIKLHSTIKSNL